MSKHQPYGGTPEEYENNFGNELDHFQHAGGGDHAAVMGEDAIGAKRQSGDAGYDCVD